MLKDIDHKAIAVLLHGQGCANHLKTLIDKGSVPTQSLIDTILDSISLAMSFINSPVPPPHHESSHNKAVHVPRISLKKKRCGEEEGLEHSRDDSPDLLVNDGFSWRKYGQKKIKTSTHQRSYYRCAYAKEGNCNATKRVQQIQDNPSVHRTTYVGQHTCQAPVFSHPTNDDISDGSKMIRFEKFDHAGMSDFVTVDNQETIEDEEGTNHIMNQECENNELLVDDDQFWVHQFPPFSPGNFISLDDISTFDYNLFQC